MSDALAAVDHLLLGTNDLEDGIEWFEARTGVRAAIGGSHPGRGTRNALAALGGRQYLEIIAPDPAQPPGNLRMNLLTLAQPRLITWAAAAVDLERMAARIRERGHDVDVRDGSRGRPDGGTLKWRTLAVRHDLARADVDPAPFFIEWMPGSIHPSEDSPKGCQLAGFEFAHPAPEALEKLLAALGISMSVRQAADARLLATLNTPKGRIELA